VKHAAEPGPAAEPPIIWSDDEEEQDADIGDQANTASVPGPPTFKQAMNGAQSDSWREAATLEYNTLVENGTWEIVDLPEGQKLIGCGWVFREKHNQDGSIECFKAQIVAKGYSQRPGLDYNESFAPTFCPTTLHIIMALAAIEDLELRSVDITAAVINGDLDEEIYMKQPEGFHIGGPNKVCRLHKSLYGLKQSACGTRSSTLFSLNWVSSASNPTVLSISTPMQKSGSSFPSTLMISPLLQNLLLQSTSMSTYCPNTSNAVIWSHSLPAWCLS
jgi:hypothetical protein